MRIEFTIPGPPVPKARPRVTRYRTYTPERTRDFENAVRLIYNGPVFEGPVRMYIKAYMAIPGSVSRKKAEELEGEFCPKRLGDSDNLAKAVMDALNGLAYEDDAQVVFLSVEKRQSVDPRTEVVIADL